MRQLAALALVAAIAACGTPGPAFRDVTPVRVHLGGSTFDIRVRGGRAEAIRLSPQWAPRLDAVGVPAALAIERVSGCRVARLRGDAARMVAALDCGSGPPPPAPRRGELFCELSLYEDGETGALYCVPADETWPRPE